MQPVRALGLAFDAPIIGSVNVWALVLAVATAAAIFRFKVEMIPTLGACCGTGVALYLVGAI